MDERYIKLMHNCSSTNCYYRICCRNHSTRRQWTTKWTPHFLLEHSFHYFCNLECSFIVHFKHLSIRVLVSFDVSLCRRKFPAYFAKESYSGTLTLILSITFMMVRFSSTVYLMFGQKKAWVLIPVATIACLPITSFVLLQFPFLVSLISLHMGLEFLEIKEE